MVEIIRCGSSPIVDVLISNTGEVGFEGSGLMGPAAGEREQQLDHDHRLWVRPPEPAVRDELALWVMRAVAAGDKVLVYQDGRGPGDVGNATEYELVRDGVDPAALARGQVEVRSAERLHAITGGDWHALRDAHMASLARAHREGFRAVALTSDGAALHASAPDTEQLIQHEHDLTALTDAHPVQVLCRYDPSREQSHFLQQVVEVHYRNIHTTTWSCVAHTDYLRVSGEIDASTAGQWRAVLHAAIDDTITEIDVSQLQYLSAGATGALSRAAERLSRQGAELTLHHPSRQLQRMLERLDLTNHSAIKLAGKEEAQ